MRESMQATVARFVVRSLLKPALRPSVPVALQRRWTAIATRTLSVPFGTQRVRSKLADVVTEVVRINSGAPTAQAILFLHGGAFMVGSPVSHRSITARLAKLTRATVFVPDYRLAPEHPFPAALDDALACYRELLDRGYEPKRIAIAGDSAGGGLAVSLCLRLRREGLPQPACLALVSPWVDLTLTQLAAVGKDALLRTAWLKQGAAAYLRDHSAQEPLASALFADLSGLPPTLLQATSEELLRNDARRLAGALTAAGVAVEHHEFPDLWHDFQLYAGIVPEATRAVIDLARFIGSRLLAGGAVSKETIRTTSELGGHASGTHLA